MDAGSTQPPEEDQGAGARPGALRAIADANAEATFGDADDLEPRGMARVPGAGLITGEVGPKGRVSAQLRGLSRDERRTYGEVPRGTVVPGGGRYILMLVAGVVIVSVLVIVVLGWLTG